MLFYLHAVDSSNRLQQGSILISIIFGARKYRH